MIMGVQRRGHQGRAMSRMTLKLVISTKEGRHEVSIGT